jgi:pyruvate,orthophosphate dikinase
MSTGLVISTEVCQQFQNIGKVPENVWNTVLATIHNVENVYGAKFADPEDPLLLSVRSGAGKILQ